MIRATFAILAALALLAGFAQALAACPDRLVTLGGDITETVFALGAGNCVVADDTTSEYPPAAKALPKVGYLRALNAEGVLSLRPDTILASDEAGPPAAMQQLQEAGMRMVLIPESHTAAGAVAKIKAVAAALDRKPAGRKLITRLKTTLAGVEKTLTSITDKQRVIFLLTMSGTPMAGGTGTAADGIITLAGGINAAAGFHGYKPLSAEAMVKLKPDVILVMSESAQARGGTDFVYQVPGVKLTPAGRNHRIYAIDGTFMLGFGPRLGKATRALAALFYPKLFTPSSPLPSAEPAPNLIRGGKRERPLAG